MNSVFKSLLLTTILFFAITSYARVPINLGVKAGLGLSNLSGSLNENDSKIAYNAGVTIDFEIAPSFYLLSGIEFTTKPLRGVHGESIGDLETGWIVKASLLKTNASYLQMPIHGAYKFHLSKDMSIMLHAGPYIAYGLGGETLVHKIKMVMFPGPITEGGDLGSVHSFRHKTFSDVGFDRFDFGLSGGLTFEFQRFSANVDYDLGLAKQKLAELDVKNGKVYFSLGYKFFSK